MCPWKSQKVSENEAPWHVLVYCSRTRPSDHRLHSRSVVFSRENYWNQIAIKLLNIIGTKFNNQPISLCLWDKIPSSFIANNHLLARFISSKSATVLCNCVCSLFLVFFSISLLAHLLAHTQTPFLLSRMLRTRNRNSIFQFIASSPLFDIDLS